MKKIILLPMMMVLCFTAMIGRTIDPTYTLQIKNVVYTTESTLEFDIYMLHTNYPATNFEYAAGQYMINFDPAILNGGTATYQIIASDLPTGIRSVNPGIAYMGTDAVLRMAPNSPLQGTKISHTGNGTLIAKMRLTKTTGTLDINKSPELQWRNDVLGSTKVAAYVASPTVEITTSATHEVENFVSTGILENNEMVVNPLSVFPSPATEVLNYRINLQKGESIISVDAIDMLGRSIISGTSTMVNQININNNVPSGVYHLQLITDKGQYLQKFSVLK